MIDWDESKKWLDDMRAKSPCQHCRAAVDHFHEDGTGIAYNERGVGFAVGLYHQSWAPLTDHDEDLPGYQWSRRGREGNP